MISNARVCYIALGNAVPKAPPKAKYLAPSLPSLLIVKSLKQPLIAKKYFLQIFPF
jgi:hypothetical protein